MDKKKIGIIAGVLAVLAAAALIYVYRLGDHSGPALRLAENLEVGYGERLGLFDVVKAVSDEGIYTISITSGGEVASDGRSTVFAKSGPATVEITAVDEHGNRTVKSASLTVVDTRPPSISAQDVTIDLGEAVDLRSGVTAVDEMDGDITSNIQVDTSQVNEARPGVYPVIYTVSDKSGNEAVIRTALTIRSPEARSISLNRQVLSLDGNSHYQLTAQVEPSVWTGKVFWESSDPHVAAVHDGLITWTGRGSCTITARADDVSTECSVECGYVTVSSIHISRRSMELNFMEADRLRVSVIPDNWAGDVVWTSSDTTVATVKDGAVTWTGQGECTITATADGRNVSCHVTCHEPSVESVSITEESVSLDSGQTYQLVPTISPSGWPGEVVWTSSDPNVATVNDGLVRWIGAGTCTITATAGSKSDSVTIICEQPFLDGLLDDLFGTGQGTGTEGESAQGGQGNQDGQDNQGGNGNE